MSLRSALLVLLGGCLLSSAACRRDDETPPPAPAPPPARVAELGPFDADRAWRDLQRQVDLGPRPSGSSANRELRDFLVAELTAIGLTPIRESFVARDTPVGSVEMENVYADFAGAPRPAGEPPRMLVLGAHFDTKRLPFRFVGANDGASETAVLLELARVIAAGQPRPLTYRFLFLDGEEAIGEYWIDPDNRYGSRHHVGVLARTSGALRRIAAFVLLDMVGDADLQLERDSYSTRSLLEVFTATARDLGMPELFARWSTPIKDDHLSFLEKGVPSIDLIDLHYGPTDNEYWHTGQDLVEHCSKASLEKIGRLVLAALPRLERQFTEGR